MRQGLQQQAARFEAEALGYIDSLYRTALRLTRNPADAEDLVQDTYLKAFRSADRFEPGTNMRAWLFTILHNTARNMARDRARHGGHRQRNRRSRGRRAATGRGLGGRSGDARDLAASRHARARSAGGNRRAAGRVS